MNCAEFRENLMNGRYASITPRNLDLWDHLQDCPGCADMFVEQRRLSTCLEQFSVATAAEVASGRVEELLVAEFRSLQNLPAKQQPERSLPRHSGWIAAAAVLLALGLGLTLFHRGAFLRLSPESPRVSTAYKPQSLSEMTGNREVARPQGPLAPEGRKPAIVTSRSASRKHLRPAVRDVSGSPEVDGARKAQDLPRFTGFFPTLLAAADPPQPDLQLIRVTVPRRVMIPFGLAVDPRQWNMPVRADVVIGPDGLTRAVRFVSGPE